MKFGEHLRKQRLPQWRFFYLDYDGLKNTLKEAANEEWTEKDDQQFVDRLVIELDKVHSFHALKQGETQRRIRSCQRRIQTLSASQHPALSEYLSIQNEITDITYEVQDLFWYTRLNYTGFIKIVKKHDRYTSCSPIREQFLTLLHNRPFYRSEVFSQLTAELGKLYDAARINASKPFNDFASITPPSIITPIARQQEPLVYITTKYWVHPDNIMDVKTHLLKYMPLICQTGSPSFQSHLDAFSPSSLGTDAEPNVTYAIGDCYSDEMISSVYLDDQAFSSYMSRVQFLPQSKSIRLRWYGSDTRNVHVERKSYGYGNLETVEGLPTAHDDDESSTKDRHPMKVKSVPEWLRGDWNASEKLFKAYQKRKTSGFDWVVDDYEEKETRRLRQVAKEIQDKVVHEQLRPVVRTVFRRTVFQSSDEEIRISVDTDLVMAREYGWKHPDLPVGHDWRRDDLTDATASKDYYLDMPVDPANADDFHRFPYAIVEVKIRATQNIGSSSILGDYEEPDCVKSLVRARMMEPVTHFSKYVHAVSVLWDSKIPLLPFWLPQLHAGVCCPTGIRFTRIYHSTAESGGTSDASIQSATTPFHRKTDVFPIPVPADGHISIQFDCNVPSLNETTPLLGTPIEEGAAPIWGGVPATTPRRTIAHSVHRLVQAVYPVVLVVLGTAIALTIAEIEDNMLANVLGMLVAAMALAGFCLWMFVFKTSLTQSTTAM